MCNIIIETGAINNLKEHIVKEYMGYRIGIIMQSQDLSRYRRYFKILKGLDIEVYFCDVDNCSDAVIADYTSQLQGVECIIAIGEKGLIDIAKAVANSIGKSYYIVATSMNVLGMTSGSYMKRNEDGIVSKYLCDKPIAIFVDLNILQMLNSGEVANGLAWLLSCNLLVCKALYDNIDRVDIERLDRMLRNVNIFTANNILTIDGRKRLIKILFEISLILDDISIDNTLLRINDIYTRFYKDKLSIGERNVVFAILLLSLHEKMLKGDIGMCKYDIAKRVERLNLLFHNQTYVSNMVDNMRCDKDMLGNLRENKEYYLKTIIRINNRILYNMSLLKRIYVDKGLIFNKVEVVSYINSLSLMADMCDDRLVGVLRETGVLDNI